MIFKEFRYQTLLFSLFLFLILYPFLKQFAFSTIVVNLFLTYVLLSAAFTPTQSNTIRIASIVLLTACLIPIWLNGLGLLPIYPEVRNGLIALYLGVIIFSLLSQFFSFKNVEADTIYAALSAYLLIGFFWAAIYAMVDALYPHSFEGELFANIQNPELRFHTFIYFSFVTLTTLGYGDIVPKTIEAASLCQVEAIMGQFFISVLIAQIVGMRIANRLES